MTTRNFSDVEKVLAVYRPAVKEFTGKDMTLDRMKPLMAAVGNPEQKLKIIHIAGTSGKSSTAYYIAELLHVVDKKVGLTVSPHVETIAERIQIDGNPLSETKFCQLFSEFIELIKNVEPQPSYYELLIAFAYWVFVQEKVDYAVVEVGLGGLYDSTNVAQNADKICVITDIGFDHMHILGDTVREIAFQKAGIIHEGNDVLMFSQSPEVNEVVDARVKQQHAKLHLLNMDEQKTKSAIPLNDLPVFQQRNWTLAWSVYDFVTQRDKLKKLNTADLHATLSKKIPGRMEIANWQGKTLVMDGAHNTQKMRAFIQAFRQKFPDAKPAVLLSVRTKKDFNDAIEELLPIASSLILTKFKVVQDITHESTKLKPIAEFCLSKGFKDVIIEPNPKKALKLLSKQPAKVCIITGSFYLLNLVRPMVFDSSSA